jgi:asparagine synthase (glutamine-hydrolysing)
MIMATSLEGREPLLDHRRVEFVFSLPGEWKAHGQTTKWICKKTMERLLPTRISAGARNGKEGFGIPNKLCLCNELRTFSVTSSTNAGGARKDYSHRNGLRS